MLKMPRIMSMNFFPKSWAMFALMCIFASLCHGKDRPVRILYFQSPTDAPSEAFIYSGKKQVAETKLPRSNFSETFEIPRGDLKLSFLPAPNPRSNDLPEGYPSVDVPRAWDKILLIVLEDEDNALMPIKVTAIDASDKVFGGGSIYTINSSKFEVFGTIGDKELTLEPNAVKVLEDPISDDGYYPTNLYCASEESDGKPRRFVRQMWNHDDSIRRILLVMPKATSPYVRYYCAPIRDF